MKLPVEIELILKWGMVLTVGIILAVYVVSVIRSVRALRWVKIEGKLTHADMNVESDVDFGQTYTPIAKYKYTVDGLTFISERIGFGIWGTNILWLTERIMGKICVHPFYAFYNPDNPGESVVVRGFTLHHFAGLVILGSAFGIGLYILSNEL